MGHPLEEGERQRLHYILCCSGMDGWMGGWTWPPFVKPRSREGEDSGGSDLAVTSGAADRQSVRPSVGTGRRRPTSSQGISHRGGPPSRRSRQTRRRRMGKLSRGIRSRLGDQPAPCATVPLFRHEQCQTDSSLAWSK